MGFIRNNCFTECENGLLYRWSQGPRSNNKLHVSGAKIVQHTDKRNTDIRRRALYSFTQTVMHAEGDESVFTSDVAAELSKTIVQFPRNKVLFQWSVSEKFRYFHETEVKNPHDVLATFRILNFEKAKKHDHRRPVYRRTRTITFTNFVWDDEHFFCVKCDCGHFICHGCPCRHFYALLGRAPVGADFNPQCRHAWELFYGDPGKEKLTAFLNKEKVRAEASGGVLIKNTGDISDLISRNSASLDRKPFQDHLVCFVDTNLNSQNTKGEGNFEYTNSDVFVTPVKKKKKVRNAYADHLAEYEQLTKLVTSDKDDELVTNLFNKGYQELLQSKVRHSVTTSTEHGLMSLPEVEKNSNRKRQKPFGSPCKSRN